MICVNRMTKRQGPLSTRALFHFFVLIRNIFPPAARLERGRMWWPAPHLARGRMEADVKIALPLLLFAGCWRRARAASILRRPPPLPRRRSGR